MRTNLTVITNNQNEPTVNPTEPVVIAPVLSKPISDPLTFVNKQELQPPLSENVKTVRVNH